MNEGELWEDKLWTVGSGRVQPAICHVTQLAAQLRPEQCGWAAKHGTQLCILCGFLGTGLEEQKGDCAKRHYTSGASSAQTRQGTRRAEKVIHRSPNWKNSEP